jgi:hypothetical protein
MSKTNVAVLLNTSSTMGVVSKSDVGDLYHQMSGNTDIENDGQQIGSFFAIAVLIIILVISLVVAYLNSGKRNGSYTVNSPQFISDLNVQGEGSE